MSGGLRGLTAETLGRPCFYLSATGSTNTWLKQNGSELPHGSLCWTGNQTMGRGRLGREWYAADGQALAMSLLLKPSAGASLLPLICGMAVSQALGRLTGREFMIKWPNDIVCDGLKICGILCENCLNENGGFLVAGIGINLLQTADDFAVAGLSHAGSVYMAAGIKPDIEAVAADVVNRLEPLWLTLKEKGFGALHREYSGLCMNIGREVFVLSPDGGVLHRGRAVGIAPDVCLLIDNGSGIVPVHSGEVSLRGLFGYV